MNYLPKGFSKSRTVVGTGTRCSLVHLTTSITSTLVFKLALSNREFHGKCPLATARFSSSYIGETEQKQRVGKKLTVTEKNEKAAKVERRRKLGLPPEDPDTAKPSAPVVKEKKSSLPVRPATKAEQIRVSKISQAEP
ncbi:hypothetical protein LOK49_LG05G03847 [Camellia lanceoleosa]|uniref:Uncharacterized protein n=1 Tax=Camellia lanceoleosa TaxID=1840588 RepID=A0ACC0HUS2_9ERIC|nr:hypothetical protein LOK49_LG05G03847 [Camellia lanceoleosa]